MLPSFVYRAIWIACVLFGIVSGQWAPLLEDNTAILSVPGRSDVNPNSWGDSYSDGDSCYCDTTYDHDIEFILVDTPFGLRTVRQVCELLGDGPRGSNGRPRYNDIQCGNGPANNAGDEDDCPGRIEYGQEGCKYIGPKWNFDGIDDGGDPVERPVKPSQEGLLSISQLLGALWQWLTSLFR